MDSVFKSVAILLEVIALVLCFSSIYYGIFFRNKNEKNVLHIVPFVVTFICAVELIDFATVDSQSLATVNKMFSYIEAISQSLLLCIVVQLLFENISFLPKMKNGKNYLITVSTFIVALLVTIPFYVFVLNPLTDGDEPVFSAHFFNEIRVTLMLAIFIFCVVLFVMSFIKKEKETKNFVITIFVTTIIYFATRLMEGLILSNNWRGDGVCFALGFGFFFTISNTNIVIASRKKEAMIEADLNMAQKIQQDAMPKLWPAYLHHQDITINAMMATAKDVGGDLYDYFEIDENHVCFLIADVSGKGMPAALFMMTTQILLKTLALKTKGTADIMKQADTMLSESNDSLMFVTVWLGILNTDTMELEYTNAGHNAPVLIHQDGSLEMLDLVDGTVVGTKMCESYTSNSVNIKTGDRLFLYTDGVPEAHNIKEELLGDDRMLECIKENYSQPGDILLKNMKMRVDDFSRGRDPFDDVTMLSIDFNLIKKMDDDFNGIDFLNGLK